MGPLGGVREEKQVDAHRGGLARARGAPTARPECRGGGGRQQEQDREKIGICQLAQKMTNESAKERGLGAATITEAALLSQRILSVAAVERIAATQRIALWAVGGRGVVPEPYSHKEWNHSNVPSEWPHLHYTHEKRRGQIGIR